MPHSEERTGEIYILLEALLWGLFPVVLVYLYTVVEPIVALAWNTFFATIFFGVLITVRKKWHEVFNKEAFKDILFVALFLGIMLYVLYYSGLRYTTPGNASLIGKTEILFSYLFFHVWRKDHFPVAHALGALCMALGGLVVLLPAVANLQIGDLLILAGIACAPFGNFFALRARKLVSTDTVLFLRFLLSAPFIFLLAVVMKQPVFHQEVISFLPQLAIAGILFFSIEKIFWMEGIHRISVTKANAICFITPAITLAASWSFLSQQPTVWQLLALAPITVGLYLLSRNGTVQRQS